MAAKVGHVVYVYSDIITFPVADITLNYRFSKERKTFRPLRHVVEAKSEVAQERFSNSVV